MPVATIHQGVLDAMAGVWTRHLYFDAEQQGEAWGVVLRGEDKAKAGSKSNKPALKWNDASGEPIPFTLATLTERAGHRAGAGLDRLLWRGRPAL